MLQRIIALLLITIVLSQALLAQHQYNTVNGMERVDSILQSAVAGQQIPGALLQVKHKDRIIYSKAFGFAEVKGLNSQRLVHPETMTKHHLFDLASLTKVVGTTTSIMLLSDRGKISVDDAVGKYIPAFDTGSKKHITIRHLLTHTAGLITWYPLYYRAANKQEVYQLIHELPLAYETGKGRHYSDLGFILLGEIIEIVSGMPLDQFQQKNIFDPLGMRHTLYNPKTRGFRYFAATSHGNPYETRMVHDTSLGFVFKEIDPDSWNVWRQYTLRGEVNDGNAWYAMQGISGHAGLFSTIHDLQKFVDMLMNKGKVGGKTFISEEIIRQFLTQDEFKNGLGWMMDPGDSFMKNVPAGSYGHTGFTGTSIVVVPSMNISIILLINRQNMGLRESGYYFNVNGIRKKVLEEVMSR